MICNGLEYNKHVFILIYYGYWSSLVRVVTGRLLGAMSVPGPMSTNSRFCETDTDGYIYLTFCTHSMPGNWYCSFQKLVKNALGNIYIFVITICNWLKYSKHVFIYIYMCVCTYQFSVLLYFLWYLMQVAKWLWQRLMTCINTLTYHYQSLNSVTSLV